MAEEKKYQGYGYHGGGRKALPENQKKKYITLSISGTPEEIQNIKEKAKKTGLTVSRFVITNLI